MTWIADLQQQSSQLLRDEVFQFFRQGATQGMTTAEAETAWQRLRLRPRVLRDVSTVSTQTTVMGHSFKTPVLVAPTTLQRQAHPDGEAATARACTRSGSLMVVSTNAGTKFTTIQERTSPWWIQAYIFRDRDLTIDMLRKAKSSGASAIVLTVDTPEVGQKHSSASRVWDVIDQDHLLANVDTAGLSDGALDKAADITFRDIAWLREQVGLPVVVKGVIRGDDALSCAEAGAAGIWVSNHGGRQLDLTMPTAVALPDVAEALRNTDAEIYVDGGVRRGEHVLSALAMGARAVFIGRPALWALSVGGEGGVYDLLDGLTQELRHAMTLAGAADLASLTPDLVHHHAYSA